MRKKEEKKEEKKKKKMNKMKRKMKKDTPEGVVRRRGRVECSARAARCAVTRCHVRASWQTRSARAARTETTPPTGPSRAAVKRDDDET